jgi:hypothetical protein
VEKVNREIPSPLIVNFFLVPQSHLGINTRSGRDEHNDMISLSYTQFIPNDKNFKSKELNYFVRRIRREYFNNKLNIEKGEVHPSKYQEVTKRVVKEIEFDLNNITLEEWRLVR